MTRAVKSALHQSLKEIEVIVVVDGGERETMEILGAIDDPRLKRISTPSPLGAGGARNAGIGAARGQWVAFLDDDALWLPEKLAIQLAAAIRTDSPFPVVACRVIARNHLGDHLWPRRYPRHREAPGDYLFIRKSPFSGEGLFLPSMIMAPRKLFVEAPFREDLIQLEDYEWLMRSAALHGAQLEFVPSHEPLVVWNIESGRPHLSQEGDWLFFIDWIRENRHLVSRRAYASFVLNWAGSRAAQHRRREAFRPLLRESFKNGQPSPKDILSYISYWLIPSGAARKAAHLWARLHPRPSTSTPQD